MSQILTDEDFASMEPEIVPEVGIDLSLIDQNLRMTPWESILENDDVDQRREARTRPYGGNPCRILTRQGENGGFWTSQGS